MNKAWLNSINYTQTKNENYENELVKAASSIPWIQLKEKYCTFHLISRETATREIPKTNNFELQCQIRLDKCYYYKTKVRYTTAECWTQLERLRMSWWPLESCSLPPLRVFSTMAWKYFMSERMFCTMEAFLASSKSSENQDKRCKGNWIDLNASDNNKQFSR